MRLASIICTVVLLSLLWLVSSQAKRNGFVVVLDNAYRAEIEIVNQTLLAELKFPPAQSFGSISNQELLRSVKSDENFPPESIFQIGETIYLTDNRHGKLSRFNSRDGLKTIAVFGGKLKKLQSVTVDQQENIHILIQSDSNSDSSHIIRLIK